MNTQRMKLSQLVLNSGQIAGLPANPREWTEAEVKSLAKSLKETPELFEPRPIIAVEHDGKYVILGGNLRFTAAQYNKATDVPVYVLPSDTPVEKLKEIVLKDNGSFGRWDYDALANEWDDLPLADWGVPCWSSAPSETTLDIDAMTINPIAESGESKSGLQSITFVFQIEDAAKVNEWIGKHSKEELSAKIVELCRIVEAK